MLNRVSLLCHIIQWLWITFDMWQTWSSVNNTVSNVSYFHTGRTLTLLSAKTLSIHFILKWVRGLVGDQRHSAGTLSQLTYLLWHSAAATDTECGHRRMCCITCELAVHTYVCRSVCHQASPSSRVRRGSRVLLRRHHHHSDVQT